MRVQRVLMPDGSESWTVLGPTGDPVGVIEAFLAHLQALDRSPTTLRTYATSLKLWAEYLDLLGVTVDEATVDHVRQPAWPTARGRANVHRLAPAATPHLPRGDHPSTQREPGTTRPTRQTPRRRPRRCRHTIFMTSSVTTSTTCPRQETCCSTTDTVQKN